MQAVVLGLQEKHFKADIIQKLKVRGSVGTVFRENLC
jgi:hypothetical protein